MAKRIAILFAAVFAFMGIVVIAALLYVTSESGSKTISEKLKADVYRHTNIEISLEKIGISLFPPGISVSGIKGKDQVGRFDCSLDEAELRPSILSLLAGNLTIEEVYLGTPICSVTLKTQDMDFLLAKQDTPSQDTSFSFSSIPRFDLFAISNAQLRLSIDDPGRIGKLNAQISGFGLDVTGDIDSIEIRGLLKHLVAVWEEEDKHAEEKILGLEFRIALTEYAADIRHLSAKVADSEIALRDAHIPIPLWPKGPNVADISISLPLDSLNRLPLGLPEMRGFVKFHGNGGIYKNSAEKITTTSKGKIELSEIEVDDFIVGDLVADVVASPSGIAFKDAQLNTADGSILLSGDINLQEKTIPITINANLFNIELGRLLEQLTVGGSYVTQNMTGPVRLAGTLNPFSLRGDIKIDVRDHITRTDGFRTRNHMIALALPRTLVTGPITVTDTYFEGRNLSVKSGSSQLTVNLAFDFPGFSWNLSAVSKDLNLSDVGMILGMRVAGNGPVTCDIWGPINNPRIRGSGTFAKAELENMAFDRASTEVNYHNMLLSFDNLQIVKKSSLVKTKSLSFDFKRPKGIRVETKIDVERAAVENLLELFHIDPDRWGNPAGMLFGKLAVNYLTEPENLTVSADLIHDKIQIFGERFRPDVFKVNWNNGELVVTELGLTKGRGTVYITGAMRQDGTMSFVANVNNVNLSSINHSAVTSLETNAAINAFVVVEGTLDHPTGMIEVSLSEAERLGARYGPSSLSLTLNGDKLYGKGTLAGDWVRLEHLMLDLAAARFQVETFVKEMDIIPIIASTSIPKNTTLKLTGDLSLSGSLKENSSMSGNAELMHVDMTYSNFTFKNRVPMIIRIRNDRFRISDTRFSGPDIAFDFGGSIDLNKMNLKVVGLADLRSAADMVDGISKTNGKLRFELFAAGPLTNPVLRGNSQLENGNVRISGFPFEVTDIAGKISLSTKVIRFSDFSASAAGGQIGMAGELDLSEGLFNNYTFRLTAQNLEITPFKTLTLKASTTKDGLLLSSSQKNKLPSVTGDVEISYLRYTEDIRVLELSDLSVDRLSGTQVIAKKPKIIDPLKDFLTFDVRLHGTKDLEAHNNLFDVKLAIDDREKPLRLVGTNQNFGFSGRVLGTDGKVRFAGRRFDIRYAALDFLDPDRPDNPYFQVITEGSIRDWKVNLTAEGTTEEYELKLSAQPYLSKEDTAFLVLTGLTQAENRQFNRGVNLGMPLIGQLGPGGGELPVELQVYSKFSDNAGKDTTRIAMGRWLNEDIWVSISSSVGQTRDVEAQVDYKINDQLSVSGKYEEDYKRTGNVGLDLKFRLEF